MTETKQGGNSNNRSKNRNHQGGNNRNRNNRSKQGGGKRNNQNKNRNRSNNSNNRGSNRPTKKPLSFWQKILALFGVKPSKQSTKSGTSKPKANQTNEKKPQKRTREPQKVEVTSGRLYVGNLSYETTEYDLEDLFKGNGPVKGVEIIYNRHTHKSKGYGFVEMRNIEDAKNAVNVHHDQPFMGRNMIVNGAKRRQDRDDSKPSPDRQSAA